jgi:hypothetical protein
MSGGFSVSKISATSAILAACTIGLAMAAPTISATHPSVQSLAALLGTPDSSKSRETTRHQIEAGSVADAVEAASEAPKMLILRGNSAGAGSYPDEKGNNNVAWPIGALHVQAASDYARRRGYEPVVLDKPGQPQSQVSPQAKAALKAFLDDEGVAAFYGFSGGGYNLKHILDFLASNKPDTLHRIALVVVIGAPTPHGKHAFM